MNPPSSPKHNPAHAMIESSHLAADESWMDRALALAAKGLFSTSPNPRVGCVLVKDGQRVGEGWHERAGGDHAEVMAIKQAGSAALGATAFVTLEPCNHHGRTPPCTQALIRAGIRRVVVATEDPDPRTAGDGVAVLRQAGISVDVGLRHDEATELNIGFLQRHRLQRPWVRMKLAASLDGRATSPDGRSQWITSEESRADGHRWRARACAILTGIETLLADDPQLNVRLNEQDQPVLQPVRVILDSHARVLEHAKIWDCPAPVWVVSTQPAPDWWQIKAEQTSDGSMVWHQVLPNEAGRIDLCGLMDWLANSEINELHVEAGPTLSGALLELGLVDEVVLYQAPVLLGDGQPMVRLPGLVQWEQQWRLSLVDQVCLGPDQRFRFRSIKQGSDAR